MLPRTKESWTASILHYWNLKHRVLDMKENWWIIPRPQIMNQGRCHILDLFCYILLKYFFDLHIWKKYLKNPHLFDSWTSCHTFSFCPRMVAQVTLGGWSQLFSPQVSIIGSMNGTIVYVPTLYIYIYTTRELTTHRIYVMSGICKYRHLP